MRLLSVLTLSILLFAACHTGKKSNDSENLKPGTHKVVVQEVLQTTQYTYLHVTENEAEKWLAIPKLEAKIGDTYYYAGGMEMVNFPSKELNRNFDKVIFLERVVTDPNALNNQPQAQTNNMPNAGASATHQKPVKPVIDKQNIKITAIAGGVTIADLFSKKTKYAGKTIKVKGKVVKYSAGIMQKNWIHLQDGTDFSGKFDLTVTTNSEVKTDDVIVVEGKVSTDKDFGFGYFYEVLIEDAKISK